MCKCKYMTCMERQGDWGVPGLGELAFYVRGPAANTVKKMRKLKTSERAGKGGDLVTFSVMPLNLARMLKRGTWGMMSCSFSSL